MEVTKMNMPQFSMTFSQGTDDIASCYSETVTSMVLFHA